MADVGKVDKACECRNMGRLILTAAPRLRALMPTLVGQRPDSECRGKRSRDQMPSGMWMVPMATDPAFQTPFL